MIKGLIGLGAISIVGFSIYVIQQGILEDG
jgi:preprotein translocase subunit Sss1